MAQLSTCCAPGRPVHLLRAFRQGVLLRHARAPGRLRARELRLLGRLDGDRLRDRVRRGRRSRGTLARSAQLPGDSPAAGLPVAVIGAGPVGLAAAAHLVARGLEPLIFEAGDAVGAGVREWGHVRVFSPWELDIDPLAGELLAAAGWVAPHGGGYPTGSDIVERYLEPLAGLPAIAPALRLRSRVVTVTRHGTDKLKDSGRADAPFSSSWSATAWSAASSHER